MRYLIALLLLVAACSGPQSKVDSGLVGTWELMVPNAQGVARWVWEIHADGTYAFHAEGPGNTPAHVGTFTAKNGQYALSSTTIAWTDNGTYTLQGDALQATGKLGTGTWHRVQSTPAPPPAASMPAPAPVASAAPPPAAPDDPNFAQVADPFERALCKHLLDMDYEKGELPSGFSAQPAAQVSLVDAGEQHNVACQIGVTLSGPNALTYDAVTVVYLTRGHAEDVFQSGASIDPAYRVDHVEPGGGDIRCGKLIANDGQFAASCEALEQQAPKSDKIPPVIVILKGKKSTASNGAGAFESSLLHAATDHVTFAVGFASLDLMFSAPN